MAIFLCCIGGCEKSSHPALPVSDIKNPAVAVSESMADTICNMEAQIWEGFEVIDRQIEEIKALPKPKRKIIPVTAIEPVHQ